MAMPSIDITFETLAATAIKRSQKGTLAMILSDKVEALQGAHELENVNEIAKKLPELSVDNKKQIELAFMGYVNPPKKVLLYIIGMEDNTITEALDYFSTVQFDYITAAPNFNTEDITKIVSWVKTERANDHTVKSVLPNIKADSEGVVNFTTEDILAGGNTYTAAQYCSRVAGLIAGTPMKISTTYAAVPEVEKVKRLTKTEMDKAVDNGEFIFFHNGREVLTGRAVNSLTTTTKDKGEIFKKIKIVETIDMINNDIRLTLQENYIGKYPNSYDSKCLLIPAIKGYLEGLEREEVLEKGYSEVNIDIEAQENYLKSQGMDTSEMDEEELKKANTGSKIFIVIRIKILDAIEDIRISVGI